MEKRMQIKWLKFYLLVGAAFLALTFIHTIGSYPGKLLPVFLNCLWNLIYIILVNYIFFEYTIPFVLKKRKTLVYNLLLGVLLLWVYLMLWSYGSYGWRQLGVQLTIYTPLKVFPTLGELLQNRMGYSAGAVFFMGIIRHIYTYIRLNQDAQKLRIEKQSAELNYLKSQTNPHFLFNTLNNIYSLARDKSDLAPEAVLRLSKILRFMLYETAGDYISVEQELKIIADYIQLEKLRYDETLRINFNHDVEDLRQALPPLLLLPLVENAFKHGVSETRGNAFIDIHLSIGNRKLLFIVKNSTDAVAEPVHENIGLSNLRRQLELLYSDYELSVQPNGPVFIATLKINLSSHVKNQLHSSRR